MNCPVEARINMATIDDMIADRMWSKASWHEANSGLEQPDLSVAQKVAKQLYSEGKGDDARAFECIVCHGNWGGARAPPPPTDQTWLCA